MLAHMGKGFSIYEEDEVNYMSKSQKWISRFIFQNLLPIASSSSLLDEGSVSLTLKNGFSAVLIVNIFGDIIEKNTGEVIAVSDLPRDLDLILSDFTLEPKEWRNSYV